MRVMDTTLRRRRDREVDSGMEGRDTNRGRLLPFASGLGFIIVLIPGLGAVPEPPGTGAPFEQIASYYGDNVNGQLTSTFIWGLALMVFLLFIGSFFSVLRAAEGGSGTLSLVALGSGTVAITVMIVAQAVTGATAIIASDGVNPEIVRGMDEIGHMIAHLFGIPLGAFLIAASIVSIREHVTWRWLGVLGIATGLAVIVGTAGIFRPESMIHNLGVLGLLGFVIWTLGTAVSLLRSGAPIRSAIEQPVVA